MPEDILDPANVDSWLARLADEAYDVPALDGIDSSGCLFNAAGAAELNEPEPDLAPTDSVSSRGDAVEATVDDADIPFLPSFHIEDRANSTATLNDEGPVTPTPVFTHPDFFADATFHIENDFDLSFGLEDPTKFFLPDHHTPLDDPDETPLAESFKATPVEDEKFQSMMTFLEMASQQMTQQGMDLAQMLSCVNTFRQDLMKKITEKTSLHPQQPQQAQTIDLSDDNSDFNETFNTLPAPTFGDILGGGIEV